MNEMIYYIKHIDTNSIVAFKSPFETVEEFRSRNRGRLKRGFVFCSNRIDRNVETLHFGDNGT